MNSAMAFHSDDLGKLLLRLAVGGLLIFHGVSKLLHGIGWLPPMLQMHGIPGIVAYGVFVAEVVAPVLIVAGWRTRAWSLIIASEMLMILWLEFRDRIFTVKPAGGGWTVELEVFFLLGSLVLFFMGSGKYSISGQKGSWD